jgi:hypothetical protein
MRAVRLASVNCRQPVAAQDIFALRDGAKVRRIAARAHVAQMVDDETLLDRTVSVFKRHSVREHRLRNAERIACPSEHPIASVRVDVRRPRPARIRSARAINL